MSIKVNDIYCPLLVKGIPGGINVYGNPCQVLYVSDKSVLLKSVADTELIYGNEKLVTLQDFKKDWKSQTEITAELKAFHLNKMDARSTMNVPEKVGYNRYRLNNRVEISFTQNGHVNYHFESEAGMNNPITSYYIGWIAAESARLSRQYAAQTRYEMSHNHWAMDTKVNWGRGL